MKDELTEQLEALRRFRQRRLVQLMRDLEAGRPLGSACDDSESESPVRQVRSEERRSTANLKRR